MYLTHPTQMTYIYPLLCQTVKLGYDPYASAEVSHTNTRTYDVDGSARLVTSGIETHKALITVEEDVSSLRGIPASFDFAVLLYLPEQPLGAGALTSGAHSLAFEIELSVEASLANGLVQESWARLLGSPRAW